MDPMHAEARALEEGVAEMMVTIADFLDPEMSEQKEIQLRWSVRWAIQSYRLRLWGYLQEALKDR
jgi:hypothetical protein